MSKVTNVLNRIGFAHLVESLCRKKNNLDKFQMRPVLWNQKKSLIPTVEILPVITEWPFRGRSIWRFLLGEPKIDTTWATKNTWPYFPSNTGCLLGILMSSYEMVPTKLGSIIPYIPWTTRGLFFHCSRDLTTNKIPRIQWLSSAKSPKVVSTTSFSGAKASWCFFVTSGLHWEWVFMWDWERGFAFDLL